MLLEKPLVRCTKQGKDSLCEQIASDERVETLCVNPLFEKRHVLKFCFTKLYVFKAHQNLDENNAGSIMWVNIMLRPSHPQMSHRHKSFEIELHLFHDLEHKVGVPMYIKQVVIV